MRQAFLAEHQPQRVLGTGLADRAGDRDDAGGGSRAPSDRSSAVRREREIKSWKSARLIQTRLLELKEQIGGRVPIKSGLTDWS